MYFTETPHLQRIEQMMISIPYQIPRSSCFRCNGQNYHDQITTKLAMQILLDSFGSRKLEKRMKGIAGTVLQRCISERYKDNA